MASLSTKWRYSPAAVMPASSASPHGGLFKAFFQKDLHGGRYDPFVGFRLVLRHTCLLSLLSLFANDVYNIARSVQPVKRLVLIAIHRQIDPMKKTAGTHLGQLRFLRRNTYYSNPSSIRRTCFHIKFPPRPLLTLHLKVSSDTGWPISENCPR